MHFTSTAAPGVCDDVVESYRLAAQRLGYATSYTHACIRPGVVNVLMFVWSSSWESISHIHPDCIVVNFEQMVPGSNAWNDNYLGLLKRCYLWEYSKSNFHRYTSDDVNVVDYVPLAYEPDADHVTPLPAVLPDAQQDIDVLFFGALSQRRRLVLQALRDLGLRVVHNSEGQVWSTQERDGYLRRAKLVLNLHTWDNSRVVEVPRLAILFRRRKAVVCELYPDSEIDPALRDAVAGSPYDQLVATVQALLASPAKRAELERTGLDIFSRQSQAALLGPALDRFIAWRACQLPDTVAPDPAPRVTVCMAVTLAQLPRLTGSIEAWTAQTSVALDLVLVVTDCQPEIDAVLANVEAAHLRVIRLPFACNRAAALNVAFEQASGDYIVFCTPEDVPAPGRLHRQSALLTARADIDIVGSWVGMAGNVVRVAQRHHDIVAELFGPAPLPLGACLLRKSFLQARRVLHDPEFDVNEDLHFICKSVTAGARFAAIAQVLHESAPSQPHADPARAARLGARARTAVLQQLLPDCTHAETAQLARLYDHLWPPESAFVASLLQTLGRACAQAPRECLAQHEALVRVLRHEALRLLRIFSDAGLIDSRWLQAQFTDAAVAAFLAPARDQLPVQPVLQGAKRHQDCAESAPLPDHDGTAF